MPLATLLGGEACSKPLVEACRHAKAALTETDGTRVEKFLALIFPLSRNIVLKHGLNCSCSHTQEVIQNTTDQILFASLSSRLDIGRDQSKLGEAFFLLNAIRAIWPMQRLWLIRFFSK
jgi:hypothetical protein